MSRRVVLSFIFFAATLAPAREKTENWIQVTSPNFVVVTNSSEKQGRRIADQFERMRSVFHVAFPKLRIDPGVPIIVLAIKDEKDFRALEPADYLAKGSLKIGGLFLRAPDKNYVLMRLDAEGGHPYSVVYHEYTHLLTSKAAEWMPLWMNEGLAEFYQNTDIHEKDALLGEPSNEEIYWLREHPLLPLPTLFTVDQRSPYYHEENKGSIFYAESWALVHYIQIGDFKEKTHRLTDYSTLLTQKVDPVTAATQAFGDLTHLQSELEGYVRGGRFGYLKMTTTTEVDDSAFKVQALTETQSEVLRADFLAYNQRNTDAQALLDRILRDDPSNVSAQETKGFLEFRQGHLEEARKWYTKAVQLDSQSFLAHYYFAAIGMNGKQPGAKQEEAESSLRMAIKLNPSFAPAFDRLAVCLAMQGKDLDEARMMGLTAVSLEPANIGYRIDIAHILLQKGDSYSAVQVLLNAAKIAKSPQEATEVATALTQVQAYADAQVRIQEQNRRMKEEEEYEEKSDADGSVQTKSQGNIPHLTHRPEFVAKGPHQFLVGVLKGVHCDNPALDLTVNSSGKVVALHIDNYYKIQFTALGFQPSKDLNPCADLEDRPAKVEYVESANPSVTSQLISVELHK